MNHQLYHRMHDTSISHRTGPFLRMYSALLVPVEGKEFNTCSSIPSSESQGLMQIHCVVSTRNISLIYTTFAPSLVISTSHLVNPITSFPEL